MRVDILGVPVDAIRLAEAVERILALTRSTGKHHIATPNPEMIVEAQRNPEFRSIFRRTALNIPDGTGLLWAARKFGSHIPERVTGTDVMIALCKRPDLPPIFLLGGWPRVAGKAAANLTSENPPLKIVGTYAGSPLRDDEADTVDRINRSGAKLLFVAYGAPAQELWIDRNLPKLSTVHVAMGVGGAFNFIAGNRKRAPRWLQRAGLEWTWRLILEPKRFKRIWNAVVVFPILVVRLKNLQKYSS